MLEPETATLLLVITGAFLAAGFVKGAVGMGLPTISMGLLTLGGMPPAYAASVMVGPALVTNLWQAFSGPYLRAMTRRFRSMMAFGFVGTLAGSGVMAGSNAKLAVFALGVVLFLSTAYNLLTVQWRVPRSREWWMSPIIGAVTGLITGATGAFIFPIIPYMAALELNKDELIQLLGVTAIVSSLALGIALGLRGSLSLAQTGAAAFALVPAFAGMFAGQLIRRHISERAFRRIFQFGMLLLGAYLALKNIS
jgi:uncharacterized membrane protein YfcA